MLSAVAELLVDFITRPTMLRPTKFLQNRTIRGRVIDDSANIPGPFIVAGWQFCSL